MRIEFIAVQRILPGKSLAMLSEEERAGACSSSWYGSIPSMGHSGVSVAPK